MLFRSLLLALGFCAFRLCADTPALQKPADPFFEKFSPLPAPAVDGLYFKQGDRLAICGDSITEQKMYSRIMETYLTVCVPQLEITTRQYGWSGETAGGFLNRMDDDCLRFSPTIATTCYGMNDFRYVPFKEDLADRYLKDQTAIVEKFKQANARVIVGSPGTIGKIPTWVKSAEGTVEEMDESLCKFRNIDVEIAEREQVRFADIFWPMLLSGFEARRTYGNGYEVDGRDGVHPGWAGHTVMAYAFLKEAGLDGNIGTVTLDMGGKSAAASEGHQVQGVENGKVKLTSSRYPFCAPDGDLSRADSIRSGMQLIPFNADLNRFTLIVKNGSAQSYMVTWGAESHVYTAEQLGRGVNLAADFVNNPFFEPFKRVDEAVKTKQEYETKQIKQIFHELLRGRFKTADEISDPEMKELFGLRDADGNLDKPAVIKATEEKHAKLAEAVKAAFTPVEHVIKIVAKE